MSSHNAASAFADEIVRRLGLTDTLSVASGDAEMLWDLAYDAFMYRTRATLLDDGITAGGTLFVGGKL